MSPEERKQAARALRAAKPLLDELLSELKLEHVEAWQNAGTAEQRESHWQEVKALENTRDRIQDRIAELLRGE